jgi:hypothetical protein
MLISPGLLATVQEHAAETRDLVSGYSEGRDSPFFHFTRLHAVIQPAGPAGQDNRQGRNRVQFPSTRDRHPVAAQPRHYNTATTAFSIRQGNGLSDFLDRSGTP